MCDIQDSQNKDALTQKDNKDKRFDYDICQCEYFVK